LKILRLFPPPTDEEALTVINDYLTNLVVNTEVGSNVNKNNADHAILFEGIRLVIHYKDKANSVLRKDILALLGKFISVREANIRYLALETMARLSHNEVLSSYLMREHMNTIIYSLRDSDLSIRRRALDLVFALCDQDSATNVVNELLVYLNEGDYSIKEELVLKIAILAEKFALNLNWYVDVIVKLITTEAAGDYVSDEIRYRVYQILTGFGESEPNFELQKYAALQIFLALQVENVHETMVKLGASVLPEFGHHIADAPGKGFIDQFEALNQHFSTSSASSKAMILSSLMKFSLREESVREKAIQTFKRYSTSWDEDIQQRSIEYVRMLKLIDKDERYKSFVESTFDPLPTYPDHMQVTSVLIKRMSEMKKMKGLAVAGRDKEDKDIVHETKEEYKSAVSSALSKSKSTDPSIAGTAAKSADLLFSGDSDTKTASRNDDPMDIFGLDIGESDTKATLDHVFAKENPGDFSSEQTVKLEDETNELSLDGPQGSKWKTLIPGSDSDGCIYEDEDIKVNLKISVSKYLTRVLVEYVSMSASEINDIQAKLKIPDGIKASISSTKYPQNETDNPKAMLMMMPTGNIREELKMAIKYETGFGDSKKAVFKIPVLINKFIDKVDMEQDRFDHLWNDITENRPSSFEKIDMILKNPAIGYGTDQMTILKKFAKLLAM
jgi:AP-2 complex subunit alpha